MLEKHTYSQVTPTKSNDFFYQSQVWQPIQNSVHMLIRKY